MTRPHLTFQRYTSREAREARGMVESVYRSRFAVAAVLSRDAGLVFRWLGELPDA